MKYISILLLLALCIVACNNGENPEEPNDSAKGGVKDSSDAEEYFPVMDYLQSEIAFVDSLPVGIMEYTTTGKKTDSQYIKQEEFHRLAQEFLPAELSSPQFENEFNETSFFDKSNSSSTFLYTTKNSKLSLQRVDVLSAAGDVYDKIKSIYLEKVLRTGDSVIVKKLYWKPGRNFQMITQSSTRAKPASVRIVKVVWDNRD